MRISMVFVFVLCAGFFLPGLSHSQNSYNGTFAFLDIPGSSLEAGLGGQNASLVDHDVNFFYLNPALVGEGLDRSMSISYQMLPASISLSNLSYYHSHPSVGGFGVNLRYLDYGEFDRYDPAGQSNGTFRARDYAITISKSHTIGNYRMGANLRFSHTGIDTFTSSAMALDIGSVFIHPEKDLSVGLVIKNLGVVVSDFTPESSSELPLDVRLGASMKPEYMPVRFSLTFYDLVRWQQQGDVLPKGFDSPSTFDEVFRHTIFSTQFLVGKNLELLFGYDHKQRKEMNLNSGTGSAGFSYGLMVSISAFEIGYARNAYHLGGASNTFTIMSNLNRLTNGRAAEF